MESLFGDILAKLGISSGVALVLYFIIKEIINTKERKTNDLIKSNEEKTMEILELEKQATHHRKEERDMQINSIQRDFSQRYEELSHEIKSMSWSLEKLDSRLDANVSEVDKMKGYLEAKDARSI